MLLLLLLAGASSPRLLVAQTSAGAITGAVTDTTGARVAAAEINLENKATSVVVHTVANNVGIYRFSQVNPGTYTLTIHKASYGTVTTTVEVTVAQVVQFDSSLAVGGVSEQVTVSEGVTALDNQTTTVGSVIENVQIENLPLNGLNPFALAQLDPGISSFAGFGQGISSGREALLAAGSNNFQASGGVTGFNDILLDGIPITVCCQGQPALIPTKDIVQQFRVQTGVPPANFGRTSGAVLNFITKSGTSRIHGDLFEYSGNTIFNAAQYFTKRSGQPPIPGRADYRLPYNFNQFGGTIGGPLNLPGALLGINRAFFFFGFQSAQAANATNSIVTVPTALQRQGNFSEAPAAIYNPFTEAPSPTNPAVITRTAFSGQTIPTSLLNKVALAYLPLIPVPNLPGTINNLSTISKSYDNDWQFNLRLDAHFSEKFSSFLRVTDGTAYDARSGATGPLFTSINAQYQRIRSAVIAIGNNYIISPRTLAEFHYGFSWQKNINPGSALNFDPAAYGYSGTFLALQQTKALPTQTISGLPAFGAQGGLKKDQYTHALGGSIISQLGKHTLTYGYDGRLIYNMAGTNANPGGNFTYSTTFTSGPNTSSAVPSGQSQFDSFASFLLGLPTSGTITQTATFAQRQPYNAIYVQDDWRLLSWLTVNGGIRYEIEGGATERNNKFSQIDLNIANPLAASTGLNFKGGLVYAGVNGQPTSTWKTSFVQFGPRVGFELAATPTTLFRGGYALLYLPSTQRLLNGGNPAYSVNTAFLATVNGHTPVGTITNPYPTGVQSPQGSSAGTAGFTGTAISSFAHDIDPAYVQQYSFGMEQTLGHAGILKINYVGSHGVKLPISLFPNNLNPKYFGAPGDTTQIAFLQSTVANPFAPYVTTGTLAASTISRQQLLAAYPQYTSVGLQSNPVGSNIYNALQVSVREKYRGLNATIAYTWSKQLGLANNDLTSSQDTGSPLYQNSYVLGIERSLVVTDIPQRLVGSAVYDLPFGRGAMIASHIPRYVDAFIGGWHLGTIVSVSSGLPLGLTVTGAAAFAGSRPNFIPNQKRVTTGPISQRLGGSGLQPYINPAAFSRPLSFQLGNVPRLAGDIRAPGVLNADVSASKNFPLTRDFKLQLSGRAFNVFNRTQFGRPATTFGAANFGFITSQANSPRQLQIGLQLLF